MHWRPYSANVNEHWVTRRPATHVVCWRTYIIPQETLSSANGKSGSSSGNCWVICWLLLVPKLCLQVLGSARRAAKTCSHCTLQNGAHVLNAPTRDHLLSLHAAVDATHDVYATHLRVTNNMHKQAPTHRRSRPRIHHEKNVQGSLTARETEVPDEGSISPSNALRVRLRVRPVSLFRAPQDPEVLRGRERRTLPGEPRRPQLEWCRDFVTARVSTKLRCFPCPAPGPKL